MKKDKIKNKGINIVADLLPLAVEMGKLRLDSKNVIKRKSKNIKVIVDSLRKYGQRKPIVVNKKTMIIEAGNGTYQAAKLLGGR